MKISLSLLAADFWNLKEQLENLKKIGANYLHFDVMDGNFVQNISFGPNVLKSIKSHLNVPVDAHLMVQNPINQINSLVEAGADIITFHSEAAADALSIIKNIKKTGVKAGVAIKPGTSVNEILKYIDEIDLILIMTVNPGFGGQEFLHNQVSKIEYLKKFIVNNKLSLEIAVDGGINAITAKICKLAGADICVAGTSVFAGDIYSNIKKLK